MKQLTYKIRSANASNRQVLISRMLTVMKLKDRTTYLHMKKVQYYAVLLARLTGLSEQQINALSVSALLHDIGKLAIPDSILKKSGMLTPDEFDVMRKHPLYGFDYLMCFNEFATDADIAICHHERWDGTGYPYGLSGRQIPFEAQILAVADAFDAMTGDRLYRRPLGKAEALSELKKQAGRQFNPDLVMIFINGLQSS